MTKRVVWMLVIAVVLGFAVLQWLGPQWLALAGYEGEEGRDVVVFDFIAAPTAEFGARYAQLLAEEEGAEVGSFAKAHLWRGPQASEYKQLLISRVPHGRNLLRVVTAPEYRGMTDSGVQRSILVGTAPLPERIDDAALVVWTFALRASGRDPLLDLLPALAASPGRVLWHHEILAVESDMGADLLVLAGFADQETALTWLRMDDQRNLHDLINARVEEMAVLVVAR